MSLKLSAGYIFSPGESPFTPRFSLITKERGILVKQVKYYYSVAGFSVDFALLNPCGFLFYSLYSVAGFIDYNIGAGKVIKIYNVSNSRSMQMI